jgi:hypothetical protein
MDDPDKFLTKMLNDYVSHANPIWLNRVESFYNQHPTLRGGKFILHSGALHNAAQYPGVDDLGNYPSMSFLPGTAPKKEITKADPTAPAEADALNPGVLRNVGSDFEIHYPN